MDGGGADESKQGGDPDQVSSCCGVGGRVGNKSWLFSKAETQCITVFLVL